MKQEVQKRIYRRLKKNEEIQIMEKTMYWADIEDTEQAYSCGFNPLGSITLSEVKLETEKKKVDD